MNAPNRNEPASAETRTHYRKAFDSPYLSSADITEPVVLTVAYVVLEKDRTKKSSDAFNTAYFVEKFLRKGEPLKPMILNATNSKFMAAVTGSKFIDDWQNVAVEVFVDANVRFGKETVEGLRLAAPARRPDPLPDEVLQAAEEAADKGTAAYAEWWKSAGAETRKRMGSKVHDRMKARATEADERAGAA